MDRRSRRRKEAQAPLWSTRVRSPCSALTRWRRPDRRAVSGHWFTAAAFSSDGRRLAYGGGDGSAGFYSLRTGEQLDSLPGHTTSIWQIVFSQDGQNVVTAASD